MAVESFAIIIIMAVAAYMFSRADRNSWAFRVLPLMVAPAANLIYYPFARHLIKHGGTVSAGRLIVYLAAFAVTGIWVFFCSKKLRPATVKWTYVGCTLAFTAIVLIIFAVKLARF